MVGRFVWRRCRKMRGRILVMATLPPAPVERDIAPQWRLPSGEIRNWRGEAISLPRTLDSEGRTWWSNATEWPE